MTNQQILAVCRSNWDQHHHGLQRRLPTETIEAHRAFITRRRTLRPRLRHRLHPRARLRQMLAPPT
jgi:hypothetical protein